MIITGIMTKTVLSTLLCLRLAMHKKLEQKGIASTVILDASVGYIMSQVDYILMGAEGVVESGGIVNKVR